MITRQESKEALRAFLAFALAAAMVGAPVATLLRLLVYPPPIEERIEGGLEGGITATGGEVERLLGLLAIHGLAFLSAALLLSLAKEVRVAHRSGFRLAGHFLVISITGVIVFMFLASPLMLITPASVAVLLASVPFSVAATMYLELRRRRGPKQEAEA